MHSASDDLCVQLETLVHNMLAKGVDLSYAKQALEKAYISEILLRHKGNIGQSALALGIHRNTLSKRIRDLEIQN